MHVRFLAGHEAEAAQQAYDTQQQQQGQGQGEGGRGRRRAAAPGPGECEWVEVGVHIADVSWFVRAGGFLDGEARDRCTSVYLVDRWESGRGYTWPCVRVCCTCRMSAVVRVPTWWTGGRATCWPAGRGAMQLWRVCAPSTSAVR